MAKYLFGVRRSGLSINEVSLPGGVETEAYSQQLTASGGTLPVTWSIVAGALPGGVFLNGTTGAIIGTPNADGTFAFTVRVSDAATLFALRDFVIEVAAAAEEPPPANPVVTTSSLPSGQVGTIYTGPALQASGGTTPYAGWAVTAGALPAGLSISSATGVISGTPTTQEVANFTVTVTDAVGATGSRPLVISIAAVNDLVIVTQQLPKGTQNLSYGSRQVVVSGGVAPYEWALTGTLPTGLSLNTSTGVISGTPTVVESKAFQITVTDDEGTVKSRTYSIEIQAPGTGEGLHDYFEEQLARPETMYSASLRSKANLQSILKANSVGHPVNIWDYVYGADTDPEEQDAGKCVMPFSLSGSESQLQWTFGQNGVVPQPNLRDGTLTIVGDIYHTISFRDNLTTRHQHKFWKFHSDSKSRRDTPLMGPKREYFTNTQLPVCGIMHTSNLGGPPLPEGLIKKEPCTPSGAGAPPTATVPVRLSMWTRDWFHWFLNKPGIHACFDDWNALYSPTRPIGTRAIVSAVADGARTIINYDNATGANPFDYVETSNFGDLQRVTISGNSNAALNGEWVYTYVEPGVISIPVTSAGGTGGVVSKHFHCYTHVTADEITDPFPVYWRVPVGYHGDGQIKRFDLEANTSGSPHEMMVGAFLSEPPTISVGGVTTLKFATPHPFVTGDVVSVLGTQSYLGVGGVIIRQGSDILEGANPRRACTVIDPLTITVPLTVQTLAGVWILAKDERQRIDLGDISTGDTFTLTWNDLTTAPITFEATMTTAIDQALESMYVPGQTGAENFKVIKQSTGQVYDIVFEKALQSTDHPEMTITNATGFTPVGVTTVTDGVAGSKNNTDYLAGTYGFIAKTLTLYARNIVMFRNLDFDLNDDSLVRRPVGG